MSSFDVDAGSEVDSRVMAMFGNAEGSGTCSSVSDIGDLASTSGSFVASAFSISTTFPF